MNVCRMRCKGNNCSNHRYSSLSQWGNDFKSFWINRLPHLTKKQHCFCCLETAFSNLFVSGFLFLVYKVTFPFVSVNIMPSVNHFHFPYSCMMVFQQALKDNHFPSHLLFINELYNSILKKISLHQEIQIYFYTVTLKKKSCSRKLTQSNCKQRFNIMFITPFIILIKWFQIVSLC